MILLSMNFQTTVLFQEIIEIESTSDTESFETQNSFDNNEKIPLSFDARHHWPHCTSIGEIKNQGSCKSGWVIKLLLNR